MTCSDARKLLNPYADRELGLALDLEIEDHLRGCETCRRELRAIREVRGAVAESAVYYGAPGGLEARVRAAAGVVSAKRMSRQEVLAALRWPLVAAAAVLALAFVLGKQPVLSGHSVTDSIASEIVDAHVRSLIPNHLIDVASTNRHIVKPWFDGRIDFAPQVPDLKTAGFALAGGRLDYVDGHPAAAIVYRRNLHVINLLMWPAPGRPDSPPVAETRRGYNLVHWTDNGMAYWAISDLELAQLENFARLVKGAS